MNLVKHCKIHAISEALTPLTHMMGTSGNETIINREAVFFRGGIRHVPAISGNAIRHRMIREPGALYLVKALGLYGKLTIDQANYLFNGGSLTESSTAENLGRIAEMQSLFPLLRLLGGSLRNQVVGGSLLVQRGQLVCEENRDTIQKQLPEGYHLPEATLRASDEFVSGLQYTRGDAGKRADAGDILAEIPEAGGSNLMIYSGQSIIPGALFYHGFILQNVSPLEVGAILHALGQWVEAGGTIGGSARIGHGRLKTSIFFEGGENFFGDELNPAEVVADYIRHVEANKAECARWLSDAFPAKKGKKQKDAEPAPAAASEEDLGL